MRAFDSLASLSDTGVLEAPRHERKQRPSKPGGTPPPRRGDGGGWNEDGWFGSGDRPRKQPDPGLVEFAFWFLIVSIATLFTVFLGAYAMLRSNAAEWPPPGSLGPPDGLVWSTLLLLVSDVAMWSTGRASRRGQGRATRRRLAWTIALGVGFVALQVYLWQDVVSAGLTTSSDSYGAVFFTLTGLHAVHVVGGLVFLTTVAVRVLRTTDLSTCAATVRLASWYWHFMDVIWIVLFVVLYATS